MPDTLIELLEERVEELGDQLAYRFLLEGTVDGETETLTYKELGDKVLRVGAYLRERCPPGSRVVLIFPHGLDLIPAFLGCMQAGLIPVPVNPPDPTALHRSLPRLQAILDDTDASFGVVHPLVGQFLPLVLELAPGLAKTPFVAVDEAYGASKDAAFVSGDPTDIAFLQYTSGATSDPKGVMLSHHNLLHNAAMMPAAYGYSREQLDAHPGEFCAGWLPMYHDFGLIGGILQNLYMGQTSTYFSPLEFLRRPRSWLEAVTHFRAFMAGGPDFAFDLCVRKTDVKAREGLDLSHWRMVSSGAERVRPQTVKRFAEAFEPFGFQPEVLCPSYGLAEATLLVSAKPRNQALRVLTVSRSALGKGLVRSAVGGEASRAVVSCGPPGLATEVVAVDPSSGARNPPMTTGELWVRGPSVSVGYWGKPNLTDRVFGAQIRGEEEGTWLRTGDLGFVDPVGEVFVTGRSKDVIIVRGQNIHPEDLERAVERSHEAFRNGCSVAFSAETPHGERAAMAIEVAPNVSPPTWPELVSVARRATMDVAGVDLTEVSLLEKRSLPKTSSGKLQRGRTRAWLRSGELTPLHCWRDGMVDQASDPEQSCDGMHDTIVMFIARTLRRPWSSDWRDMSLSALGLDSLQRMELHGHVEQALGVRLPEEACGAGQSPASVSAAAASALPMLEPLRLSLPERSPLSNLQARLMGGLGDPRSDWCIEVACSTPVDLTFVRLTTVLEAVAECHEVLRTRLMKDGDGWVQVLEREAALPVREARFSDYSREGQSEAIERVKQELAASVAEGRSWSCAWFCPRPGRRGLLMMTFNHLMMDGQGARVLLHDLNAAYASRPLISPAVPYLAWCASLPKPVGGVAHARLDTRMPSQHRVVLCSEDALDTMSRQYGAGWDLRAFVLSVLVVHMEREQGHPGVCVNLLCDVRDLKTLRTVGLLIAEVPVSLSLDAARDGVAAMRAQLDTAVGASVSRALTGQPDARLAEVCVAVHPRQWAHGEQHEAFRMAGRQVWGQRLRGRTPARLDVERLDGNVWLTVSVADPARLQRWRPRLASFVSAFERALHQPGTNGPPEGAR